MATKKLTTKNPHRKTTAKVFSNVTLKADVPVIRSKRDRQVEREIARGQAERRRLNGEAKAHERGDLAGFGYSTTEGELLDWRNPDVPAPTVVVESTSWGDEAQGQPRRRMTVGKIERNYEPDSRFCQDSRCAYFGAQLQPTGACPGGHTP